MRLWVPALGGLGVAVATAVLVTRLLAVPEAGLSTLDPGAGLRVQHLVAQLLLREAGLTSRTDPLVVTPQEVNAFLGQHVQLARTPVWPIQVRLGAGWIEAEGPSTVGKLLGVLAWEGAGAALPAPVRDHPVWVGLRGRIEVGGGRGELVPEAARIGRQRVPVDRLWQVLGGRPDAMVWSMPRVVARIEIEPGRLIIHTRRPSRAGAAGQATP